jgi:hypothetical protein
MGIVLPSPPVRKPGMTDDQWRRFLARYRAEVFDPMARKIEREARWENVGLVALAVGVCIALWSLLL